MTLKTTNMNKISPYIIILLATFLVASCKKDNYDPPSSTLNGRLVYQGAAIELEYDRVPFQLYQYGFGKIGSIDGTFTPEGSYSVLLFDGEYKFVLPIGQGPFKPKEIAEVTRIATITVRGDHTMDIEVEPYYMIRNPQVTVTGGVVSETQAWENHYGCNRPNIERVSLYVNKTNLFQAQII